MAPQSPIVRQAHDRPEHSRRPTVRLERLPLFTRPVIVVVALAVLYAGLQALSVRPYLWPAGTGALLDGEPAAVLPIRARPPDIRLQFTGPLVVTDVAAGSPAAANGIVAGDRLLASRRVTDDRALRLEDDRADPGDRLARWRDFYWMGVSDPVEWTIRSSSDASRVVRLDRLFAWSSGTDGWARRHFGVVVQTVVFAVAALVLLLLRSNDLTSCLCVLALSFSAVGGGGPLFGVEQAIPYFGSVLTVFVWLASALAFPAIVLAIAYFPTRSPLLDRYPWLHGVPLLIALPLFVPALATGLYLAGVESARGMALWDASHPEINHIAFAIALAVNVLAMIEGSFRYRYHHSADERRRIRMALYTAVPGILAYAIRDGVPIMTSFSGLKAPEYPLVVTVVLDLLVLMPAFGLVYAIGVARVLGPRVVLRRSLQYALANRTLTVLGVLPAIALAISLVRARDRTLSEIVTGSSGLYLLLIAASVATFKYRERARQWLDQRFFREEYDARQILLSLANRVRFETDPSDLASVVVTELDEALHPQMIAILVKGIEEGRLTPVTVLHGSVESLPLDGGLLAMLRWSNEPLEIFLGDPRSPAHRLPPEEREWLECSGAVLLVPVFASVAEAADGAARDRPLIALLTLGERRSEEAYTAEDRQLLASIAAQMGLGFDVARLRRRVSTGTGDSEATRILTPGAEAMRPISPMMECPRCGRCEEASVTTCPTDGTAMRPVPSVPRTIDNKYRIEQLLGRGGMGAVYRARDIRLDRLVAVKVVRLELQSDPEARVRFRREAQIVARLQHPSIVAVYDYGALPDGGAYLVMELVRGEDLRRVLQREGRLDPHHAMRILTEVCSAIEAAHREGVLHRDLKPENILLPGGGAVAKVLDFGVAKIVSRADDTRRDGGGASEAPTLLTTAGTIVGTPAYMAPEQFRAAEADTRTDVYSLAVIAYEMLSGELPFGRGTLADVVLAQSRGARPLGPDIVPPSAERAIRTALDADPDRRPASPQAFAHLLSAAIEM